MLPLSNSILILLRSFNDLPKGLFIQTLVWRQHLNEFRTMIRNIIGVAGPMRSLKSLNSIDNNQGIIV